MLLTERTMYVVDEKDFKVKDKVPYTMLNGNITYIRHAFYIVLFISQSPFFVLNK